MGHSNILFKQLPGSRQPRLVSMVLWSLAATLILSLAAPPLPAREKDATQYGIGLIVNVPFPENEVTQVVQDVIQNGIIRGTKEYNKDEYVSGATPASSTRAFKEWTEGGKVFYKVRLKALDPRNFKDGSDMGTLAVRYIVQPQGDKNTVLRIDAVFVEDFRHVSHPSNGSVEGAEYKDIHDHLDAIASMKEQTVEAEKEKAEQAARKQGLVVPETSSSAPRPAPVTVSGSEAPPSASAQNDSPGVTQPAQSLQVQEQQIPAQQNQGQTGLEQHLKDLRQQVMRLVKAPGAPLKSAPFHTASTLQSLPTGTEILIVISTPYWVGVETHEGQHGWILRDELELAP